MFEVLVYIWVVWMLWYSFTSVHALPANLLPKVLEWWPQIAPSVGVMTKSKAYHFFGDGAGLRPFSCISTSKLNTLRDVS